MTRPNRKPDEPSSYYYRQGQKSGRRPLIDPNDHPEVSKIMQVIITGFDSNVKEAIEKDIYGAP